MSDGEVHFGELDESATLAMDELMTLARELGVDIDASEMMSRAVRDVFLDRRRRRDGHADKARVGAGNGGRHPGGQGAALMREDAAGQRRTSATLGGP